jgi:hypothetical protein
MSTKLALLFLLLAVPAAVQSPLAPTPPMDWNSWDAFGTTVTEHGSV